MRLLPVIKGTLTFVPGVMSLLGVRPTGGSDAASYCYGVWMKHLTLLVDAGMPEIPRTVAEVGPGDSLGTGMAALLSGARHCLALDVVRFADRDRNLAIFDDLVKLFRARARRPHKGWPDFDHLLEDGLFPHRILHAPLLQASLAPARIAAIRAEIAAGLPGGERAFIRYRVPWGAPEPAEAGSADLVISHSVMEHVDDMAALHRACAAWLRPGGWFSHQIDFTDHGITGQWNGHLSYSDIAWKLVRGRRPFLLNRVLLSQHLEAMEKAGLVTRRVMRNPRRDGLPRAALAPRFRGFADEDLQCRGALVQGTRGIVDPSGLSPASPSAPQ